MTIRTQDILAKLLKTAKRKTITRSFIPKELGVMNLATYIKGGSMVETIEKMKHAWALADVEARKEGFTDVVIGTQGYGISFSKGAMVFIGRREETQEEFDRRLDRQAHEEAVYLRSEQAAVARRNKKDREELARLQAKVAAQ